MKIANILPEINGGEAPEGICRSLSMALNKESPDPATFTEAAEKRDEAPQFGEISPMARAIVERDLYKQFYEDLLSIMRGWQK